MAAGDTRAAHRYAGALFRVARNHNAVEPIATDLNAVVAMMQETPKLLQVLSHPRITQTRKKEVAQAIFGTLNEEVSGFMRLLIERDRVDLITFIVRDFGHLVDEWKHEADAEAVSAVPLTQEQQNALVQRLESATGYKVRLKTRVDPSMIGGLTVRVGDRLFDGSVTTQLQSMRDNLKRVRVAA